MPGVTQKALTQHNMANGRRCSLRSLDELLEETFYSAGFFRLHPANYLPLFPFHPLPSPPNPAVAHAAAEIAATAATAAATATATTAATAIAATAAAASAVVIVTGTSVSHCTTHFTREAKAVRVEVGTGRARPCLL